MAKDYEKIRKYVWSRSRQMFETFDKRRDTLLEVAREFLPNMVPGLERGVEQLADGFSFDDDHRMITTLPMQIARKSASGFHSNLTSQSRQWYDLQLNSAIASDRNDGDHTAHILLNALRQAGEKLFARSNVYSQLYKLDEHLVTMGFGCMLINADPNRVINCQTLRVGTYALGTDKNDFVDKVSRRFALTAEQILDEFGKQNVPDFIKDAAKRGSDTRFEIWNLIEPNPKGWNRNFDPLEKDKLLGLDQKFDYRSIYMLCGNGRAVKSDSGAGKMGYKAGILRVAGYRHNPIVAPRLDFEQGDIYGIGRGLDGLYLARGAQTFKADEFRIEGVRAEQPVVVGSDLKDRLELGRGGINITDSSEANNRVVPVYTDLPDSNGVRLGFEETRQELLSLFFVDAFEAIDSLKNQQGVKTATEIEYLKTENLSKLGAIVSNLNLELLDPLVTTVTQYALDACVEPITPEMRELITSSGIFDDVEVEYVSQVHMAQKAGALTSVQQFVQFVASMAQIKQGEIDSPLDNLNTDETIKAVARMLNVPEKLITDPKEVGAKRQAKAQSAQAMAQQQQLQGMVDAARQMGEIPLDENHIGGAIARSMA